jgi:hypothetical protein
MPRIFSCFHAMMSNHRVFPDIRSGVYPKEVSLAQAAWIETRQARESSATKPPSGEEVNNLGVGILV